MNSIAHGPSPEVTRGATWEVLSASDNNLLWGQELAMNWNPGKVRDCTTAQAEFNSQSGGRAIEIEILEH